MPDEALSPLCCPTTVAVGRSCRRLCFVTAGVFMAIGLLLAIVMVAVGPACAEVGGILRPALRCQLFIGPDAMNFTGYAPDTAQNEFCEDIPAVGRIILTLDAVQAELRDMKIEIRIVNDVGGEARENANLDAVTVAYIEPRYYRSGTINFEHNFPEAGYFVGIVTAIGDHGERWVSRFPFSVGESFMLSLPAYLSVAIGVISVFFLYLRRCQRPAPSASVKSIAPPTEDPTLAE